MKNKPHKHKESNVFKFKSFTDRLNEVNLRRSALYHIEHVNEITDEHTNETNFHQTYNKWSVLNLTEEYNSFQKCIRGIITLPQIIHRKDFVIELILSSLDKATVLSLQPLLEFIIALAKDLRDEFYEYFPKILEKLIKLLNTQDADQLEWTLISLAYLFKILKPYLKKDITIIFNIILPLITDKTLSSKYYVQNFAAECFSYVSRDIKNKEKFLFLILKNLHNKFFINSNNNNNNNYCFVGCGRLLFEIIKGFNGQFHTCSEIYLPLLFESLINIKKIIDYDSINFDNEKQLESYQLILFNILTKLMENIFNNILPNEMTIFWNCLNRILIEIMSIINTSGRQSISSLTGLKYLINLMGQTIEWKNGKYLNDLQLIVNLIIKLLDALNEDEAEDETIEKPNADELTENNSIVLDIKLNTIKIIIIILLSPNLLLTQLDASRLIKNVLIIKSWKIQQLFFWNTRKYAQFDILILPSFLQYFEKSINNLDDNELCMNLLIKIILTHSTFCSNGIELTNWKKYSAIKFRNQNTIKFLENNILNNNIIIDTKNINHNENNIIFNNKFIKSIIIFIHLGNRNELIIEKILSIILDLCKNLETIDSINNNSDEQNEYFIKIHLFLLSILIESIIHLDEITIINKLNFNLIIKILLNYCNNYKFIQSLRLLNLLMTICKQQLNNIDLFELIHEKLSNNLLSNFHEIRQLSANALNLFSKILFNNNNQQSIYEIICKIECIDTNIQNYREQLMLLHKLSPDMELFKQLNGLAMANDGNRKISINLKLHPLKYLFGILYENFKLLWEPISELIINYSTVLPINEFWSVFKQQLDFVVIALNDGDIRNLEIDQSTPDHHNKITIENTTINSILSEEYHRSIKLNDKRLADFINYRILLWKMLPKLCNGQLIEIKNRDIVTKFLTFINDEYRPIKEQQNDGLWNILISQSTGIDPINHKNISIIPKATQRTLITKLQIFKNLSNPSQLYRESELNLIYLELLQHPNNLIQHLALDALLAYKPKYLLPYKQHLYNLIDEQQFRDTIIMFKIDSENSVILPEHRNNLMEILLRLLYCKLFGNISTNNNKTPDNDDSSVNKSNRGVGGTGGTGGKGGTPQIRKAIILRFLAGCYEHEIMFLLKLTFKSYNQYIELIDSIITNDDQLMIDQQIVEIGDQLNFRKIFSTKKLQSTLNLLDLIREQFAGLMSIDFLKYLLKLLIIIGIICDRIMVEISSQTDDTDQQNQSIQIDRKFFNLYKSVKNLTLQNLINFFNHFDKYPWQPLEIDLIFKIFIEPILPNLMNDSIHSPTQLLKLFTIFSKNSRYFILFTKQINGNAETTFIDDNDNDRTPLKYIVDLLLNKKSKSIVCLEIMEIIKNLLTLNDFNLINPNDDDQDDMMTYEDREKLIIKINNSKINNNLINQQLIVLNYGSKILLPYIKLILNKIHMNLTNKTNNRQYGLTKRDLLILSRCTELIIDSETSGKLLQLLLPLLIKKSQSQYCDETILIDMLQTIFNLFKQIKNPEEYIRDILPLFQYIQSLIGRKLLCNLLRATKFDDDGIMNDLIEIADDLNAMDKRFIEQPNYEQRINGYKKLSNIKINKKLNLNLGLFIIYQSFYFLKYDKDLAIRDTASYHLKLIVIHLINESNLSGKDLDYLISTILLNLIRKTFMDKNEQLRVEGLQLLGEMVRECSQTHYVLKDLHPLINKQDREVDFFDNIIHLQLHRHGKALMKFCQYVNRTDDDDAGESLNCRTLTQFLLPLCSMYLCTEKYAQKHGIITIAIDTIGVICRLLPWYQYETLLKYYLRKMRQNVEYQKQLIRLVMVILDSFHFDLSKAKQQDFILTNGIIEELNESSENITNIIDPIDQSEELIIKDDQNFDDELNDELLLTNVEDDEPSPSQENSQLDRPIKKQKISQINKNKFIILSHKAAKRLIQTIATGLLPTLHRSITVSSTYENFHKINRKKRRSEREEEEILRVPIALAMVKLLQKLPEEMLDDSLPGILIKVCMFLKSPLRSVRMTARNVLKSIMLTVGTKYLDCLLKQMQSLLTRGFQVHVLTVTVHCILDALKTQFKFGELDRTLQIILSIALDDIFGKTGEEKEILKIGLNTPEAKPSNKSYLTLQLCASNISETCLLDLLMPFKEILIKFQSKKIILKIQDCFQKIIFGLSINKHLTNETLLMFIYGIISESIPDLVPGGNDDGDDGHVNGPIKLKQKFLTERKDCFLIPVEPRSRSGGVIKKIIKTNIKANAHVLIEFGLELLHILLKRGKLLKINYEQYLEPIIPILLRALQNSSHIRITIFSLKCFTSMWNREMKSIKLTELIDKIIIEILKILHKYATEGMSTINENFSLVKNAFKSIVSIIRSVDYYKFNAIELKTLLMYVEQNLFDLSKQTIAFSLLKAIIYCKIEITELTIAMEKIYNLAIVSDNQSTRHEAKSIIYHYLLDYPIRKNHLNKTLKFFVDNLNYEVISGREIVIQILQHLIKQFKTPILQKHATHLFLSMAIRLTTDESIECRQQIAETIEKLLAKCDLNKRTELFNVSMACLIDKQLQYREMGAMLCTRFINCEREQFVRRLDGVLINLIKSLSIKILNTNSTLVTIEFLSDDEDESDATAIDKLLLKSSNYNKIQMENRKEERQRLRDHQLIQVLNTILKIFENFKQILFKQYPKQLDEIGYIAQKLLAYEHLWVRFNSAKILDFYLDNINVNVITKDILSSVTTVTAPAAVSNGENSDMLKLKNEYLYLKPKIQLKSLTLDLCAQLIPNETDVDMAEQVVKNLLYIANILKEIPLKKETDVASDNYINLIWLIRRIRYVVHAEVAKAPHSIILRTAIFHWIESLTELISENVLKEIIVSLLTPLVREMSEEDKNIDTKLRQLAIKVGNRFKSKIGEDEYNVLRSQIQVKLMQKRAVRRKEVAQTKINDPKRAALRKDGEKQRKKQARKRKMDVIKGNALPKTKKVKKNNDLF